MSQAIVPEICPGSRVERLVPLSAIARIITLAARDDIGWAAVIVVIVVIIVGVVVSVIPAVAVSQSATDC
jgi:hypothetical protein